MQQPGNYRIGEVVDKVGISADTLRYYEKIKLLPAIGRTASGIRVYDDKDISRLRFIRRAQKMRFRLREIAELLKMREDPQHARDEVRLLTGRKLAEVEEHLDDLQYLRKSKALTAAMIGRRRLLKFFRQMTGQIYCCTVT